METKPNSKFIAFDKFLWYAFLKVQSKAKNSVWLEYLRYTASLIYFIHIMTHSYPSLIYLRRNKTKNYRIEMTTYGTRTMRTWIISDTHTHIHTAFKSNSNIFIHLLLAKSEVIHLRLSADLRRTTKKNHNRNQIIKRQI